MIKLSIITVVKNDVQNIEKTILSVLTQNFDNFEYVVIDGESTDGTSQIIKKYSKKLKHVRSKDLGIYDALNKGIKNSNGRYVGIIHSGDTYRNKNILKIINKDIKDYDYVSYNMKYWKKMKLIRNWRLPIGDINIYNFFYIAHPTLFVKKKIFKKKNYNLKFKISADTDFLLYMSSQKSLNYKYFDKYIMNCAYGGISTNSKYFFKKFREDLKIFHSYFGKKGIFFLFYKILIKIKSFNF